jgi:hypothetical protein
MKDETGRVRTRLVTTLLEVLQSAFAMGCGMLLPSSLSESAITFEARSRLDLEQIHRSL